MKKGTAGLCPVVYPALIYLLYAFEHLVHLMFCLLARSMALKISRFSSIICLISIALFFKIHLQRYQISFLTELNP